MNYLLFLKACPVIIETIGEYKIMAERKKKSPYIYGNTARSLQEELNAPRKILSNETRKNREKAHHMNIG